MKFGKVTEKEIERYYKKPRPDRCKLGHLFTKSNSKFQFDRNGSMRRRCKKCESIRYKVYYEETKNKYDCHWSEYSLGGI